MAKPNTILLSRLRDLAFLNAKSMPKVISMGGVRKQWVGIGWVDEGPADGTETLVLIDLHE
jgi:hypothetical protein